MDHKLKQDKYKKVIINLDNIPMNAIKEIQENSFLEWEKIENLLRYFRTYNTSSYILSETIALEYFILYSYLRDIWYTKQQIKLFINKPSFIHNDKLYIFDNNKFKEVKLTNTLFISPRGSNWNYPFFHILQKVLAKKKWKLSKPNLLNYYIPFKGKLYAIKNLYPKRKKLIWDIIIPYKINNNSLIAFKDFVKENFWTEIILKKDNTQTGEGVYPCNLNTKDWEKKFFNIMKTHTTYLHEIYITPYYDFKEEYRFYFIKKNRKKEIYSFKIKEIITPKEKILEKDNFLYWQNVIINWKYVSNKEWQQKWGKYFNIYKKALEYLSLLQYETGSLEFWLTKDNKFVFFEVNWMSDPICSTKEDIKNMTHYYKDLFSNLV